jgi:N-acetylglutamate synthase-like GNAT family acetyltransferase
MPGHSHSTGSNAFDGADGSPKPRRPRDPLSLSVDPGDIRRATPADLAYVVALQKRNHEALGFIPRAALAEKIDRGQILLASENGDPAGFLHHGSLAVPEVRIFQAAIQYDARRRHHGLALVDTMVRRATDAGANGLSLRCLDFLDANDFWTAAGFGLIGTEPGARGTLNVWGRTIGKRRAEDVSFHCRVHPCPRCGLPTMDTWTRGAVRRRLCARCLARFG